MFRQITLIKFKSDVSKKEVEKIGFGFSKISTVVDGIINFDFGPDKELEAETMDYALVIDFDSKKSWREYRSHPEHIAFAEKAMTIIERVERVQYDVKS